MKTAKLIFMFLAMTLCAFSQTPVVMPNQTIFTNIPATGTATNVIAPQTLTTFGYFLVSGNQITGAPSGCQLQMNAKLAGTPQLGSQTVLAFTPANTLSGLLENSAISGVFATDLLSVTYFCTVYPTGGTLSVSYAPLPMNETFGIFSSVNVLPVVGAGSGQAPALYFANAALTTSAQIGTVATHAVYSISATNGAASVCWLQFMSGSGTALGTNTIASFAMPATPAPLTIVAPGGGVELLNGSGGVNVGASTTPNGAVACGTAAVVSIQYN